MRMRFEQARARLAAEQEKELAGERVAARWWCATVNQLGIEQGDRFCELTPLYARTGRQTLYQLYHDYLDAVAKRPSLLREALVEWRRVPDDSGANIDSRALRDAVVGGNGKALNAAVPGATWLALMAVPFFPLGGDGVRPFAIGWDTTRPGGRPRTLVWPVWREPLDRAVVEVLVAHPLVRAAEDSHGLEALGVVAVLRASRQRLANSDGPLQPASVVWPG